MTSCAATTTIREALDRLLAQDSWEKPHVDAGLAALASLELLGRFGEIRPREGRR